MFFRTPAKFYHYEPKLGEHLQDLLLKISLLQAAGEPPHGLDLSNLALIQEGERAFIVAPINNDEGDHIGDMPIIKFNENWIDECAFPIVVFSDGFGEVSGVC